MNKCYLNKIINIFGGLYVFALLVGIISSLLICVLQYFICRPLWLDEAMLALSVLTRDAASLVSSPLEWGQSASIGYLYAQKFMTSLCGINAEALRCFSFFAWVGVCVLLWIITRKIYQCDKKESSFVLFVFMTNMFYVRYANEAKPYMNDNFWILTTLYAFWLYWRERLKGWHFSLICSVAFLFSFSAAFAIASCYLFVFIRLAKSYKNTSYLISQFVAMLPLLIIGLLILIYWILPASANAGGAKYWSLWRFPLFPTSAEEWDAWRVMVWRIFLVKHKLYAFTLFLLSMVGIGAAFYCKSNCRIFIFAAALTIGITLVVSQFGFYPIESRLIQFILILIILISIYGYKYLISLFGRIKRFGRLLSCLLIVIITVSTLHYIYKEQYKFMIDVAKCFIKVNKEESCDVLTLYDTLIEQGNDVNGIYIGEGSMPVYLWLKMYHKEVTNKQVNQRWVYNHRKGERLVELCHEIRRPYYRGNAFPSRINDALSWIKEQKVIYIFLEHVKPDIVEYLTDKGELIMLYKSPYIEIYRFTWEAAE